MPSPSSYSLAGPNSGMPATQVGPFTIALNQIVPSGWPNNGVMVIPYSDHAGDTFQATSEGPDVANVLIPVGSSEITFYLKASALIGARSITCLLNPPYGLGNNNHLIDCNTNPPSRGTGAATLAALTAAGNGQLTSRGTGAATLAALTASGSGQLTATGNGVVTLSALTANGVGQSIPTGEATSYTIVGPSSGVINVASTNFTITPNGLYTGTITITPAGGGLSTPIVKTWSGSASPQTFTVTPTSAGPVVLTPTNSGGLIDEPIMVYSVGSVVTMDSTWLTANGPAPYVLNTAGTIYRLAADITVTGTAFVLLAANVTLDLGGHTVIYGNSSVPTITNPGFEVDSIGSTTVTGWDVSSAPTAAIAANTSYLFGNQVLRLNNFTANQTIKSNPISGLTAGHSYTATITPGNPLGAQSVPDATTVTLSVIDNVTSTVLGSAASASVVRGASAVVTFTPTTANAVYLRVVVTTPSVTSVDLDQATLTPSYDQGILASKLSWYDLGVRYSNLPSAVQTAYNAGFGNLANPTVRNGVITQGTGTGNYSSILFGDYGNGFVIDGLTTTDNGMDITSLSLHSISTSAAIYILNSHITQTGTNVANRMYGPAAIGIGGSQGIVVVSRNTLSGCIQGGIGVSPASGPVLIDRNSISCNTIMPDAIGIGLASVSNFTITNNVIDQTGEGSSGGGIAVDGYDAPGSHDGVIQYNTVLSQEGPTREMWLGQQARALRLRNDVDAMGPHTNIDVSHNTFATTIGPGLTQKGYTAWMTYVNNAGAMNNANVSIHDNTIKLINMSTDTAYSGAAMMVDGMSHGINLTVSNNILESNDRSLNIAGYNAENVYDLTFLSNTLRKSSSGAAISYRGAAVGYDVAQVSSVALLDTQFDNGATLDMSNWGGTGTKDVEVGWLLDLTVTHTGSPVSGASVTIADGTSATVFTGTTDGNGQCLGIQLISDKYASDGSSGQNTTPVHTSYNTFTVSASKTPWSGSSSPITLTASQSLSLAIS